MPITLMTAGAAAILNLWLAMRTGSVRTKAKIDIGDGGNDLLIRRMRAHANFVEYTPFILILIALIEFTTGTSLWLWVASAVFLLGRVGHALGMESLPGGRMVGTIITFALLLGLGGYAVVLPYLPHATASVTAPSAVRAG
ncbi:MAPEG family protein [Sphingomonas sp. TF3]|nr:MAPEG family protein [Sphingomonas sp. TF3]